MTTLELDDKPHVPDLPPVATAGAKDSPAEVWMPTIPASEIRPEPIRWLWSKFIAAGMLNVLAGPPGSGKSTILYDVAARISRDGGTALIASAEDHLNAVIRPRLEVAGADLDRVHVWKDPLTLPEDIEKLERRSLEVGASFVTMDPLVAFFGNRIDTHKDASVRQALRPLSELAERVGCAVVIVMHTNKSDSDDPLFRISGSVGFQGAARQVLLACADPADETGAARVLAVVKSNLAEFPPPLAYTLAGRVFVRDDGVEIPTSAVSWGAELPGLDPRSLLRAPPDPDERTALAEAMGFLGAELADGPRLTRDVETAARGVGISDRTLKRAKHQLGIRSERINDFSGRVTGWRLHLPDTPDDQPPGGQGGYGPVGPLDGTRENSPPNEPEGQGANTRQTTISSTEREDVGRSADLSDWVRVEVRPATWVGGTEEVWRRFVAAAFGEMLELADAALRRHVTRQEADG